MKMGTWSKIGLGFAGIAFIYASGASFNSGRQEVIDAKIQGFQMAKLFHLETQFNYTEFYKKEMHDIEDMYSNLIKEWHGNTQKVNEFTNSKEEARAEMRQEYWDESMHVHGLVSDEVNAIDRKIEKLKKQRDDIDPRYSWLNQL